MVGSGTAHMPISFDRPTLPGTARTRRPSGRGSTALRSFAARLVSPVRENAVSAEWYVPAENRPPARTKPSTVIGPSDGQLLDGVPGAQVVRDRVEAAGVHQPRPGAHRLGVVSHVHQVDELRLAGDVQVVGAGRGARGHQRLAVVDVRPDGAGHHPGALGDRAQRGRVGDVGGEQRQLGQRRVDVGQPVPRTAASLAGLRPASAHRSPAGACRARYSAVRPPVKPVAPNRTRSYGRSAAHPPSLPSAARCPVDHDTGPPSPPPPPPPPPPRPPPPPPSPPLHEPRVSSSTVTRPRTPGPRCSPPSSGWPPWADPTPLVPGSDPIPLPASTSAPPLPPPVPPSGPSGPLGPSPQLRPSLPAANPPHAPPASPRLSRSTPSALPPPPPPAPPASTRSGPARTSPATR